MQGLCTNCMKISGGPLSSHCFEAIHGAQCSGSRGGHVLIFLTTKAVIQCERCLKEMTHQEMVLTEELLNAHNLIPKVFPKEEDIKYKDNPYLVSVPVGTVVAIDGPQPESIQKECTCPTLLNGHWDGCPLK